MPPAVIDLTSSPEPDDSPETLAKSSLNHFQPRKQKPHGALQNNSGLPQRHGRSPSNVAQSPRVADIQPRNEEKKKSNGFPYADENGHGWSNGHGGVKEGTYPLSRATLEFSPNDARREIPNARYGTRQLGANTAQEGSLASLLEKSSDDFSNTRTADVASARPATLTPERRSTSERNVDNENERLKMLGAFQRVPSKAKPQPAMVPREKPPEKTPTKPRPMSATEKPLREFIDLELDNHVRDSSGTAPATQNRGVLGNGDSPRPFKRRRTNDSEGSNIQVARHVKHPGPAESHSSSPGQSINQIPIRSTSPPVSVSLIPSQAPNAQSKSIRTSFHVPRRPSSHETERGDSLLESRRIVESTRLDTRNAHLEEGLDINRPSTATSRQSQSDQTLERSDFTTHSSAGLQQAPNKSLPSVGASANTSNGSAAPVSVLHQTKPETPSVQPGGGLFENSSSSSAQVRSREIEKSSCHPRIKESADKSASPNKKLAPTNAQRTVLGTEAHLNNSGGPGGPYSAEEDALLIKLKEVDGLAWEDIVPHFNRSYGSLQVRYSTKLKGRSKEVKVVRDKVRSRTLAPVLESGVTRSASPDTDGPVRRPRKRRNNEADAAAGYISWAEIKRRQLVEETHDESVEDASLSQPKEYTSKFDGERAYPKSLLRILRQRELGSNSGRSWTPMRRSIPDELKERVLDDLGPRKYFKGTSGDVTCLAWASDGKIFAAGSIAITDERSMQYNRPYNLLLGHRDRALLKELPEHHIQRPSLNADDGNVNALHSMRETQDPRLFMTVASVQFSPDGKTLYSAGSDRKVRAYQIGHDDVSCLYEIEHAAPLDLLSVSNSNVLATACHQPANDSIGVYRGSERLLSLSPSRVNYPSALKWGVASHHTNLLLAGFSVDSIDEEQNIAGETALWDIRSEARINLSGMTRNVFDLAWNPSPSAASSIFAVASSAGIDKASKETKSVIQWFAPSQNRARKVLEWECPAFDVNDVVYCQHDVNLIAAGATDGKVYVWDHRFIKKSNSPLHTLYHGDTLNVLDHDREREVADTGVRFLSWGATSSRLFSGSSDGVVKLWNPYRSSEGAHIKNVATFDSAIMSGAFSPDYSDLLIGEDQGRINLLSTGCDHKAVRSMQRFELQSAPTPSSRDDPFAAARELRNSGQIAIKPMGDLPIRQAVQGPNYRGPYLRPSEDELLRATNEYQLALDAQNDADLRKSLGLSPSDNDQRLQRANMRVETTQAEMTHLYRRYDDSILLEPLARENQKGFLRAAERRHELDISKPEEPCRLGCNYVPPSTDDGEVPDSHRSEMRIPGALRSSKPAASQDMSKEEILEAGLTARCMSCLGAACKARSGKPTLCERCHLARTGFNASCDLCADPIRLSTESSDTPQLCERCSFACFRCGNGVLIARNVSSITCHECQLTWEAGVLGYELVSRREIGSGSFEPSNGREGDNLTEDELGENEITYYASRWHT